MTFVDTRPIRAGALADGTLLPSVLNPQEWALLSAAGNVRAVLPGEQLFRRGDNAHSLFLIDTRLSNLNRNIN